MSRIVIGGSILEVAKQVAAEVPRQMASRAYRASNELRNSALGILGGQGSGRVYGGHQASAPGEPPAAWTGAFRLSWQPETHVGGTVFVSSISTNSPYAGLLENGTPHGQMAPRPHHDRIREDAMPKIVRIYGEPYF